VKELSSRKTTQITQISETQSQQVSRSRDEHEQDEARDEAKDDQIADVSESIMIFFQM